MATIRSARAFGVVPSANITAKVRGLRGASLRGVLDSARDCLASDVPAVAQLAREVLAAALATGAVEELEL